jgi:hypothetical protein
MDWPPSAHTGSEAVPRSGSCPARSEFRPDRHDLGAPSIRPARCAAPAGAIRHPPRVARRASGPHAHDQRVCSGWRTCPGSSQGGQRTLRARCVGGSPCNSLSAASARSRSRRSSTIRARIVAKSSAARGWVIGFSRSLDLVLTVARSPSAGSKAERSGVNFSRQVSAHLGDRSPPRHRSPPSP